MHVGHDSEIGECCRIHTGSQLAGHVTLGDGAILNLGVTVNEGKKIGSGARIGNGSTVVRDIPARSVYFGNPARSRTDQRNRSTLMKRLLEEHGLK